MGRKPFKISNKNEELFFLRDCQGQARQLRLSWVRLSCQPLHQLVRLACWEVQARQHSEAAAGELHSVVIDAGAGIPAGGGGRLRPPNEGWVYLLEHSYTAQDCSPCAQTGGKCRVDDSTPAWICWCASAPTARTGIFAVSIPKYFMFMLEHVSSVGDRFRGGLIVLSPPNFFSCLSITYLFRPRRT